VDGHGVIIARLGLGTVLPEFAGAGSLHLLYDALAFDYVRRTTGSALVLHLEQFEHEKKKKQKKKKNQRKKRSEKKEKRRQRGEGREGGEKGERKRETSHVSSHSISFWCA